MKLISKHFGAKIRKSDEDGAISALVSTAVVDRDGDVMLPGGIDLGDFKGTMLINHDTSRLPIGKWLGAEKKGKGIIMHGQLASRPPEHPSMVEWVPDTIKHLIREDVLNGVSVGFTIKDSRQPTQKDADRYGESVRRIINEWSLLECSIVPIGANQEAIITSIGKSAFRDSILFSLWGVKKNLCTNKRLTLDLPGKPALVFQRQAALEVA